MLRGGPEPGVFAGVGRAGRSRVARTVAASRETNDRRVLDAPAGLVFSR